MLVLASATDGFMFYCFFKKKIEVNGSDKSKNTSFLLSMDLFMALTVGLFYFGAETNSTAIGGRLPSPPSPFGTAVA